MARIRSIKPSFFTSEDVSALPMRARLTWIGLWTHCDDQGRAKDNTKLIKAAVWPLDSVTLAEIEEDLTTLAAHTRIVRYMVDGKRYLAIVNWHDHQRPNKPSPSRLPAPPSTATPPPLPEPSGRTTGDLPEDERRPPEGNKEGRGSGVGEESVRAREREACNFLEHEYRLTDQQARRIWHIVEHRAPAHIDHPVPYLRGMLHDASLAAIVEQVQESFGPPPDPGPALYVVPAPPPAPDPEPVGPPPLPAEQAQALAHASTCHKPRCPRCADIHERWPDLRKSGT